MRPARCDVHRNTGCRSIPLRLDKASCLSVARSRRIGSFFFWSFRHRFRWWGDKTVVCQCPLFLFGLPDTRGFKSVHLGRMGQLKRDKYEIVCTVDTQISRRRQKFGDDLKPFVPAHAPDFSCCKIRDVHIAPTVKIYPAEILKAAGKESVGEEFRHYAFRRDLGNL